MIAPGRVHFVYWLFTADGECLYIGRTSQPKKRWKRHCKERPFMASQVAIKRMSGPYYYWGAYQLERNEQIVWRPRFGKLAVLVPGCTPKPSLIDQRDLDHYIANREKAAS